MSRMPSCSAWSAQYALKARGDLTEPSKAGKISASSGIPHTQNHRHLELRFVMLAQSLNYDVRQWMSGMPYFVLAF
jgi:hypothetical protein